ncbi:MAG: sigma-70 family RNA polymerase sigma factor [Crocinitomicaceae bacterium]|nr:sigma-70 family RNA polymerase sigma factor [Crocinitomicaceae bacterium]
MSMKTMDDQQLITSYLTGDNKAFETLLLRHKNRIFRFILMKIKDRDLADDIFQETFVKIINTLQLGKYNEEGKFLPWAMRIAHNLVIDHFRKTSKVRMISESSSFSEDYSIFNILSTGEENTLETMTRTELENQMVDLIDHLPETQREIIQMRIFQDLSFKDIAEMENISINTALGRMRYALMNLRKLIDKHQLVIDIA